jgi:hypothetical protein
MFYNDHAPPHIHVVYGDHRATVQISTGAVLAGSLPRRAGTLVGEWVSLHQHELRANWERARRREALLAIPGLE